MLQLYSSVVALIVLFLLYHISRWKQYVAWFRLPGPWGVPFLGIAHYFFNLDKVFDKLKEMRHTYGNTWTAFLGPYYIFYVGDPDVAQSVLGGNECINKSLFYKFFSEFCANSILVLKNPKWSQHRKLLNPSFNQKVLTNYFPEFNAGVDVLVKHLGTFIGKGYVELVDVFERCTLDITCKTTMGTPMNFQNGENLDFLQGMKNVKTVIGIRIFSLINQIEPIFQKTKWHPLQVSSKKLVKDEISNFINKKASNWNIIGGGGDDGTENNYEDVCSKIKSLPHSFIEKALLHHLEDNKFTFENVLDDSAVMIIASYDSVALAIFNTILCLAMYPKYQDIVFEEIKTYFPEKDFNVKYEDTKKMVFTEMVIQEAMRILPPIPFIAREVSSDFKLNDKITLPKGTQLFIDIFNMQRDPKFWGSNANEFNPYNFTPEMIEKRHPYAYLPFSKGPRNCIGYRYANMVVKVILAKILRNYRFTTKQKMEDFKFRMAVTMLPIVQPTLEVHRID